MQEAMWVISMSLCCLQSLPSWESTAQTRTNVFLEEFHRCPSLIPEGSISLLCVPMAPSRTSIILLITSPFLGDLPFFAPCFEQELICCSPEPGPFPVLPQVLPDSCVWETWVYPQGFSGPSRPVPCSWDACILVLLWNTCH